MLWSNGKMKDVVRCLETNQNAPTDVTVRSGQSEHRSQNGHQRGTPLATLQIIFKASSCALGIQTDATRRELHLLCKSNPPLLVVVDNVLVLDEQISKQNALSETRIMISTPCTPLIQYKHAIKILTDCPPWPASSLQESTALMQ